MYELINGVLEDVTAFSIAMILGIFLLVEGIKWIVRTIGRGESTDDTTKGTGETD